MLSLVAVPLLVGCVTMNPFRRSSSMASGSARVDVRNDRWEDLTVYLQREGSLLRLGVVPGKGSTTLTVPEDYVRLNCTLRLVARTIGREMQGASEQFGMGPGSRITWHIPLTNGESPVAVTSPAGWGPPDPR
jgi:hypothetical protein